MVGLYALGLQEPRAGQTALCVNSLQQLENCIRNGTLLCSLADGVFGIPIKAWSKTPRSYNQCLSNVQKATEGLQRMRGFPLVIYGGADDDIVRGEWSIIVELLHCLSTHPGGMLLNAKKPVSTTRSRPSWETVCNTEIVPSRAASAVAERGSSSSDMKDAAPGDDIFDDTFLPPKPPHVSNRAADLYPAGAVKSISHTPLLRSQNRHEDVLLDVDIDDAYRTLPADSEVAAILSESISSKLIRELQAASIGAAREDSPPPPPPRDRNEQPPDILPTKEIIKKGPRGDMILVQRRTPAPQTAAPPSTPSVARSSLDTPDWIRDLQSIGGAEKRPQNKDHDEVHSVQESPGPAAEQPTTSRRDALLDAVTRRGQDASEGSLRSNLKRASQRSSSAPPAKRQPPVAYNAHPLPKEGQDVLTSKRIRDAKIIISWLTDLNVDTEPLKDLIRIVRERHSQESDREGGVAYGYVNPVPAAFPQKDITSCMCELVATLDWKYPHSPQSLSHAALGSIPGTVTHPRHQAHRLQNIKRAFEVLANNNKIPLSALTCEEAVLEGRIDIILSLLMTIRKAYSISIGQR